MDNIIFNVNGSTKKQLTLAVELLLLDEYDKEQKVKGWYFSKDKGLVLTKYLSDECNPFTDRMGKFCEIGKDELVNILFDWIDSDEANSVKCEDWDANADHDGHNNLGWRLYTEDWGHVHKGLSLDHSTIAAFKPVYLWYGK